MELVVLSAQLPWAYIALVLLACCLGDWAQRMTAAYGVSWGRAVLDTTTHGVVALLSWCAISCPHISWRLAVLSGVIGSAIDLDHAIAAGGFDIHAMTHLTQRPPLHATTPWLVLLPALFLSGRTSWRVASALMLNAVLTHHVRDAFRRGLWMPPWGSTRPLPLGLYLTLEAAIPLIISGLLRQSFKSIAVVPEFGTRDGMMDV